MLCVNEEGSDDFNVYWRIVRKHRRTVKKVEMRKVRSKGRLERSEGSILLTTITNNLLLIASLLSAKAPEKEGQDGSR